MNRQHPAYVDIAELAPALTVADKQPHQGAATDVSVLLVDDRPENLLTLSAILEEDGYRLVTASSGHEALKWVLKEDFALIIMDVQMPELNGFETAKLIKQRERSCRIPIIFVTAINKEDCYVFRGYQAGAVDYMFKPFDPDILRTKVAVFAELHRKSATVMAQAAAIEERNRALEAADRHKDEFLSVISHELRTPLNFITGFASFLEDSPTLADADRSYASRILHGADRMLRLVDDLIDYAELQAGRVEPAPRPTHYGELVEAVISELRPQAACKGVRLVAHVAFSETPRLDPERTGQALRHLVGNAIKFTPEGGQVSVRANLLAGDGGFSLLTEVSDTGPGIAEEDIPRLFQKFRQLDMGPTRDHGGFGLGLAITKELIETQGGTLGIRPTPGAGATFWYQLPLGDI